MIIYKCDICNKEFSMENGNGEMIVRENTISFIKHQKAPQARQTSYLFCLDCAKEMQNKKKFLEKEHAITG